MRRARAAVTYVQEHAKNDDGEEERWGGGTTLCPLFSFSKNTRLVKLALRARRRLRGCRRDSSADCLEPGLGFEAWDSVNGDPPVR